MRIAAIVYVFLSLVANFIFDSVPVLVLAMVSFPLSVWLVLTKKEKTTIYSKPDAHATEQSRITERTSE